MNRDTLVALCLLLFCGLAFGATFAVPESRYSTISAAAWPQFVVAVTAVLTVVYLVESLRDPNSPRLGAQGGLGAFFRTYGTPIACFGLFAAFVAAIPWLGMLLSGFLFVFFMLTLIGERTLSRILLHLAIASVTVGGLWLLFTHVLYVMLPAGRLFRYW